MDLIPQVPRKPEEATSKIVTSSGWPASLALIGRRWTKEQIAELAKLWLRYGECTYRRLLSR